MPGCLPQQASQAPYLKGNFCNLFTQLSRAAAARVELEELPFERNEAVFQAAGDRRDRALEADVGEDVFET